MRPTSRWVVVILIAVTSTLLVLKGPELACRFKGEDWIADTWRSGDCVSLPEPAG